VFNVVKNMVMLHVRYRTGKSARGMWRRDDVSGKWIRDFQQ
jgi:hypothetical protein